MEGPFKIEFDFLSDDLPKGIHLKALAEVHHSETHYKVSEVAGRSGNIVMPDFDIKKKKGKWVHTDSERETDLSRAAGQAIERLLDGEEDPGK